VKTERWKRKMKKGDEKLDRQIWGKEKYYHNNTYPFGLICQAFKFWVKIVEFLLQNYKNCIKYTEFENIS